MRLFTIIDENLSILQIRKLLSLFLYGVHDYRRCDSLKLKFHVFCRVRKKLQLPIEQPYRNAYVSRGYNICLN